jgi:hypothetical protein
MKRSQMLVLVFGFVCALLLCSAFTKASNVVTATTSCPQQCSSECDAAKATVKMYRRVGVRPVVSMVKVESRPQAKVEFERRTPSYRVIEETASPYVVRGLFNDRVRVPRRPVLSVEKVE